MSSSHEISRQAAVRRYAILDTPPDGNFDNITPIAARIFDVPIAIVSIVDHDSVWFKSDHGPDQEPVGLEQEFYATTILKTEPTIIPDARLDPQRLTKSLVAGEFGLRFDAAAPRVTSDGLNLGALCVVVDELELREAARRVNRLTQELHERTCEQKAQAEERFQQAFDNAPIGMAILSWDQLLVEVNPAFCDLLGYQEPSILLTPLVDLIHADDRKAYLSAVSSVAAGEASRHSAEWRCKAVDGRVVWCRMTLAAAIRDRAGHPKRFIAQVENITHRKVEEILGSK